MKIAVIGAGVIGICTAYELTQDGHQVTVYEKNSAAAEGSSFANAGVLNSGLALTRSMPPWPSGALAAFSSDYDKIQVTPRSTLQQMRWLWAWRHAHKNPGFWDQCKDLHALLGYSQTRLQNIATSTGFGFERQSGQLLVCRDEAGLQRMNKQMAWLKELGTPVRAVSEAETRVIEPALATGIKLTGAWHFPSDETVNSRQFSLLLKNEAMRLGTQFHFNTEVVRVAHGEAPEVFLKSDLPSKTYDAVVVCTGSLRNTLYTPTDRHLPMENLHGYALSAVINEPLNAPRGSVIDTSSGNLIARIGNRVRVTHGAILGNVPGHHREKIVKSLYQMLQTFFPSAVGFSSGAQIWQGMEFSTADGQPYLGPSSVKGIWLNIGHGANGWGLACGCARVIADLIQGKKPEVNFESMLPSRKPK